MKFCAVAVPPFAVAAALVERPAPFPPGLQLSNPGHAIHGAVNYHANLRRRDGGEVELPDLVVVSYTAAGHCSPNGFSVLILIQALSSLTSINGSESGAR